MARSVIHTLVASLLLAAMLTRPGAAQPAGPLRLGVDDRIELRTTDWPELAGEYVIAPPGRLSLPLLGVVETEGLTVTELEARLLQGLRAQARFPERARVTVQVVRYRPVYILGEVQSPGEHAYRPGMTLIQLVSMAGGYYRLRDPGLLRLERDAIQHSGDLQIYVRRAIELAIRRTRLEAELEPGRPPQFSPPHDDSGDANEIRAMQQDQLALFQTRTAAVQEDIAGLDRRIALYEEEISALQLQIQAETLQLRAVERELEEVRGFVARQLAPTPRLTLLERTAAKIMSDRQLLETAIIRARQNISTADTARTTRLNDRKVEILDELRATRVEEAENQRRIETARQLIAEAEQTAPAMAQRLYSGRPRSYRFQITRQQDGAAQVIATTDPSAALLPGDVVQILEPGRDLAQQAGSRPAPRLGTQVDARRD